MLPRSSAWLAVLEQHSARGRRVSVPGDHCCWLWAVGVCSGEIPADTFILTPYPRGRLTLTARRLTTWMHAQRRGVSDWLNTPDGKRLW